MGRKAFYLALGLIIPSWAYCQTNTDTRITEQGAEVLLDGSLHTTGAVRADRYFEFVNSSTPTAPSSTHARGFWNSTSGQFCIVNATGTVSCLTPLSSINATDPIIYNSATANISLGKVSLSTGVTGVLQPAQQGAHLGDVTSSSGSYTLTANALQANITTFSSSITVTNASGINTPKLTVNTTGIIVNSSTNACGYLIGTIVGSSQTVDNQSTTSSGTGYTATTTAATFTPKCASDKVKITVTGTIKNDAQASNDSWASIFRGSTDLSNGQGFCFNNSVTAIANQTVPCSMAYLDSPATASSITYSVKIVADAVGHTTKWNQNAGPGATSAVIFLEDIAN